MTSSTHTRGLCCTDASGPGKARHGKASEGKRQGRQGNAREAKGWQDNARQCKARYRAASRGKARKVTGTQGKARQCMSRYGKEREGRARQGKARYVLVFLEQGRARAWLVTEYAKGKHRCVWGDESYLNLAGGLLVRSFRRQCVQLDLVALHLLLPRPAPLWVLLQEGVGQAKGAVVVACARASLLLVHRDR